MNERRLGAVPRSEDGRGVGTEFTLWAPHVREVVLDLGPERLRMEPVSDGHHAVDVAGVGVGQRYAYRLDGADPRADPATRSQPEGITGWSEVIDPGTPPAPLPTEGPGRWEPGPGGLVLYEIHVGTFTPAGTFDAAIEHLDRLAGLGVTAIELMPIAQFPGRRNWGYDGVFLFAAQHSYGGRAGLRRLVEAAHGAGLGVVLDVVHNHFGPEGNHLHEFGPYVTDRVITPWGPAVNVADTGSDAVRRHLIDSAVEWVTDVGIDGLRLDAVHAIIDPTARPFLEELASAVHAAGRSQGRSVVVIAESSANDPRVLGTPGTQPGGECDAVWNDDVHHALRVALGGERSGYYADYDGVADLARCLEQGWLFEGRFSVARGRRHGRPLPRGERGTPPFDRLVVADQNHDQIGNRAAGERLDVLVDGESRKLAAAAIVLGPYTPMLFMGEEYGETAPFPYFIDHADPDLLEAVRQGRREEFPQNEARDVPDPSAPATFASAVLDPSVMDRSPHSELVALYNDLLAARRTVGVLSDPEAEHRVSLDGPTIVVERRLGGEGRSGGQGRSGEQQSRLLLHFGDAPRAGLPDDGRWEIVIDTADERYGGPGSSSDGRTVAPRSAILARRI